MVRKLLKHELIALFRVVYIPAVVMVGLAILLRISAEGADEGNGAFIAILTMFYIFALCATIIVCYVLGITRFYKSFFSGEGYMTLSLPATASQLIWSKLLSSLIVMAFGTVACVLSGCIFLIGLDIDFATIGELLGAFWQILTLEFGAEPALFIIESVIQFIVMIPAGLLVFYLVISIAQLFTTKNRKGMIFAIYFGGSFICGIVSSVVVQPLNELMMAVSIHLVMWMNILFYLAVDVGCFFIVRYILTHKVNMTA